MYRQLADTALHGLLHGRGARPRDGRRLRLQQAYQLLDCALHEAARRDSLDYVAAGRHGARPRRSSRAASSSSRSASGSPSRLRTQTGINNIDKSFFEAARTLGAKGSQLVFRIAIPFVMPNIFQGLTQGMSSACTALLVAEMIGVESASAGTSRGRRAGRSTARCTPQIVLICVIFVVVNALLTFIRRRVLRWQEGAVHE